MAVDDAELLALAGEDSSDDEAPQPSGTQVTTASPLPSIEISRADSDKFAAKYGKSASKSVRGSSGNTKKKTQKDESEEEGEA